jgi:hypothetical protein
MFDFQLNKVSIKANISFLAKYLEKVYFQSTERKDYTIKKQYKVFIIPIIFIPCYYKPITFQMT